MAQGNLKFPSIKEPMYGKKNSGEEHEEGIENRLRVFLIQSD